MPKATIPPRSALKLYACDLIARHKNMDRSKLGVGHFKSKYRESFTMSQVVWFRERPGSAGDRDRWHLLKNATDLILRSPADDFSGGIVPVIVHDSAENVLHDLTKPKPQEVDGTHYQQGVKTSPWDLQMAMESTGDVFLDSRRSDIVKYVSRIKGKGDQRIPKMISDFKKARHCLEAAIARLEAMQHV